MKSEASSLNKPFILVIEDNADQWFLIRYVLSQQFPDLEAVRLSKHSQVSPYLHACLENDNLPHLLLLDLYLPHPDMGFSVLKELQCHQVYRHLPTVVLSQSTHPDDIAQSFDCGAKSYIVKPGSIPKWQEALSQLRFYWEAVDSVL